MDNIISEVKTQPKLVIENGVKKYVYTFEEFEKVILEYMESQGHTIDTDFVPDLMWAEDCFTDKYLFTMEYENNKRYVMEEELGDSNMSKANLRKGQSPFNGGGTASCR